MVSVIIVSFNTREILAECLMSLFRHAGEVPMEVFVVDNASKDGSPSMVRERFPAVRLIENSDNRGFAAANNQAYTLSQGDYVVLLNPDAYLQPESLANAVAFMDRTTGCGLSGGKIISPKGTLEPSARRFPSIRSKLLTISGISGRHPRSPILNRHEFGGFNHDAPMEVDWVPGTFTIVRRSMLESIGFFDERFYLYYEETDLCRRAKNAGWSVYFIPDASVIHIGGACSKTRKEKTFDDSGSQVLSFRLRSECLYYRKNHGAAMLIASTGLEIFWNLLIFTKNMVIPSEEAQRKRTASIGIGKQTLRALKDTRFGTISPPTPW
ncbi:MAG: glycosyl hydrolase [Pelodictyon luteolum]|uniref:Glycosyl hydrolase n=1 Tax=Pelodictyon luteolum TaxID=1100 RepID=A0A165LUU3_PELLU|nr:glycosyltransferase family 2 protein [Pelodictyon luteolum]KZK74458.1 MAG: glycosyl hydrolase [Pelodictyon luteolum]